MQILDTKDVGTFGKFSIVMFLIHYVFQLYLIGSELDVLVNINLFATILYIVLSLIYLLTIRIDTDVSTPEEIVEQWKLK